MDINSTLNEYGKNISDENILNKIYYLSTDYSLELSKLSIMLASFLLSKGIDDTDISVNTIEAFEKENLIGSTMSKLKLLSPTVQPINKKIQIKSDIFDDYIVEGESMDSEQINDIIIQSTQPEQHFEVEIAKCDINKDDHYVKSNVIWPVILNSKDDTYEYMYQLRSKMSNVFESHGLNLIQSRIEQRNATMVEESNHLQTTDIFPVSQIGDAVLTCGTIVFDDVHTTIEVNEDAQNDPLYYPSQELSRDNIALQGFSAMDLTTVPLNIAKLSSYCFFPGQTVILKGSNSAKTGFDVSEVLPNYTRLCSPISTSDIKDNLRVLMASGPYSLKNTDDEDILNQLMELVTKEQCDLLVMIGPFVDAENEAVERLSETKLYSSMYEKLSLVAQYCIAANVHVVFVPSINDAAHTDNIFPQPSFEIPEDVPSLRHPLVHFAPNPGFFTVGPFSFGVTSVDILRHLTFQEVHKNYTTGIKRQCRQILHENNFYPLRPANDEVNLDWLMWPKCDLGTNPPHCLIMPSKLTKFKEDVDGVLCINPGHAATDDYKGKCAILTLRPSKIADGSRSIVSGADCQFIAL